MNKKRIAQYCCAALVAAGIGLNIQNALADYGIGKNSLSLIAIGGSGSGSSSSSSGDGGYYPSGDILGTNETYIIVPSKQCYTITQVVKETTTVVTKGKDGKVTRMKCEVIDQVPKFEWAYSTRRVKKYDTSYYETCPAPFTQTCSDLGMDVCPVPPLDQIIQYTEL